MTASFDNARTCACGAVPSALLPQVLDDAPTVAHDAIACVLVDELQGAWLVERERERRRAIDWQATP